MKWLYLVFTVVWTSLLMMVFTLGVGFHFYQLTVTQLELLALYCSQLAVLGFWMGCDLQRCVVFQGYPPWGRFFTLGCMAVACILVWGIPREIGSQYWSGFDEVFCTLGLVFGGVVGCIFAYGGYQLSFSSFLSSNDPLSCD